jgi:glutaconate CoA-transferase subunit A
VLPGFRVDAVVEVPYGAHPTSFFPLYGYDTKFHVEWTKVARDAEQTQEFLRRYVLEPETQADYLAAVGGSERLMEVTRI